MKLEGINWDGYKDAPILDNMKTIKTKLKKGSYQNLDIISNFIQLCNKKHGETITKYYVNNVFYRYFSYD